MADLAIIQNTAELERLEGVINKSINSFYELGRALAEIRDRGYYRDVLGFETFEGYLKERWDFSRRHAYRFIDSAKVVDNVTESVTSHPPENLEQTRPLARLEPDQQREAWQQAVDTAPEGKVTAAIVAKVVKGMTAPAATTKNKPKPKEVKNGKELISEEFRKTYEALFTVIQKEKLSKWKTTSKEAASKYVNCLIDVITIK